LISHKAALIIMVKKIILMSAIFTLVEMSFISCSHQTFYASDVDIPKTGWQSKEAALFSPEIIDTLQSYNLLLSVSNSDLYRYSNLWLFVRTKSPDGFTHKDTLNIPLAEESGKWFGKKQDDQWNFQFYFKKQIRFPKTGRYTFEIQHGMRDLNLQGINKLSFELVKCTD
jgi:gliding motility-associated lipoprotein GldH